MRSTCSACFRPVSLCLCRLIPRVANRTGILVLQHLRERFHPFGSARMLVAALERGRLEVVLGRPDRSLFHPMELPANTGLLYPHADARELGDLLAADRPDHLVLLDGTWSHAKRLYDDNPWLWALPHFAVTPDSGSRYLVRREPKEHCLSTLEAAVEALQCLEPGLEGLEQLLGVFVRMNTDQVARRGEVSLAPRTPAKGSGRGRSVPDAILEDPTRLVFVHTESVAFGQRADPAHAELLRATAVRLMGTEHFDALIQRPGRAPSAAHLARLGLRGDEVEPSASAALCARQLRAFLRPDDILVAWRPHTFGLLPPSISARHRLLSLKACYCNLRGGCRGTLEHVLRAEGLFSTPAAVPGRAGQQLGHARAMAAFLRAAGQGRGQAQAGG